MSPTDENIREVAEARIKAIRARAHGLGDVDSDDERLLRIVIADAIRLASRTAGSRPDTAQAAVAWAIADMYARDEVVS